jgi:hypothetical protein
MMITEVVPEEHIKSLYVAASPPEIGDCRNHGNKKASSEDLNPWT